MADRLAILIGNGRFDKEPSLPQLFGPRHDVAALGRLLSDPDIGNFVVFEHLDRDSSELVAELDGMIAMAGADSTVVFYYAGWALTDPGRGLFLATADTSLADISGSSVPLSTLKQLLRNCGAQRLAVILDCCYGGPTGQTIEADVEHELRRIRNDVHADVHVIASPARSQDQDARETVTGSGLEGRMTRCIVEGISTGAADRDGDNRTSVRDLNEYLGLRLGDERPLWAGPLEGVDPEIVANPHPIAGVDLELGREFDDGGRDLRRLLQRSAAVLAAGIVLAMGWWLTRDDAQPRVHLESFYGGPGLPENVGLVADLETLRAIIDRTGWIEHNEELDGTALHYPAAITLLRDPAISARRGTIRLALRQWAIIDLADGIYGVGISCAPGLNVAAVTVQLLDGRQYTFDVRTDRQGGEFFGFVARHPILRVRIDSPSTRFDAQRLYFYADHEFAARAP